MKTCLIIRINSLIAIIIIIIYGTCFKFSLIATLVFYLDFIIYCRAYNVFGTLWWVSFLSKFVAGALELGNK